MTAVPVLVPPSSGVLSRAYMTTAMFRAYPHWLDLDDLIPGGVAGVQDDALADVLLTASDWAAGVTEEMPLHGHWVQGETLRAPVKSSGRVHVRPKHIPVRAVTSLSWGADPSFMQPASLPDASMWFEGDGRRMSWRPGGGTVQFAGPAIQFGARAPLGGQVYVDWSYLAGFPWALLSAVSPGDMSVTVDDPSSILPGDVLRVYDPGKSEALTVAGTYVPALPAIPPAPASIPLAAAAANSHEAGTGITGFPRKALQGIIAFGVALLMREDVSAEEPSSPFGPSARTTAGDRGGKGGGLVNDAYGWLRPYAPTLRS